MTRNASGPLAGRRARAAASAVALAAGGLGTASRAMADANGPPVDDRSTVTFAWENDSFAGTDRNYTNGVRLAWLSGTGDTDGVSEWVANVLGADPGAVIRRGVAVGHSLFTPRDISAETPPPDQHPYAGWAYAEYTPVIEQANRLDQFTFQLGLVGPSAGGEWLQNEFHALIGEDTARGWSGQLDDEVTVGMSYDRTFRRLARLGDSAFGADLTPTAGVTFGTVHTHARLGVMGRIGEDLRNDYGPPRVRPSLAGAGFFTPQDSFSWYLFGGVEGRAVAHNLFLDGSLFRRQDSDLTSRDFVADIQAGAVLQFENVQVGFTVVFRTEEYVEQSAPQRFGAFSLSGKF